jgi:hypothetical protein
MDPGFYGVLVGAFMFVLSLFVLVSSGSLLAVLVLWATIALVITVLIYYGFLSIDELLKPTMPPKVEPTPVVPPSGGPLVGSEVFHISDASFTYDEAPAVCAAYGGELATLEQIMDAFAKGAEWCGYGWSAGGMALYPTQRSTWDQLQGEVDTGKRTRCGRPGVNGGYFDPSLKFGVNCYGFKPKGKFTPPAPLPGSDTKKFRDMVNKFKEMLKSFTLDPYSRQEWSSYGVEKFMGGGSGYGSQFTQDLGKLQEGFQEDATNYVEPITASSAATSARPLQAPFGLLGDKGDKGEVGVTGSAGTPGAKGTPGAAGPQGGAGPQGTPGKEGTRGPGGEKGDKGEKGAEGLRGAPGSGSAGGIGPKGDKGDKGERGSQGIQGFGGLPGPQGSQGAQGGQGAQGPAGVVPSKLNVQSIKVGDRWTISDEGGPLVIRDGLSGGDKRYAIFQNQYRNL